MHRMNPVQWRSISTLISLRMLRIPLLGCIGTCHYPREPKNHDLRHDPGISIGARSIERARYHYIHHGIQCIPVGVLRDTRLVVSCSLYSSGMLLCSTDSQYHGTANLYHRELSARRHTEYDCVRIHVCVAVSSRHLVLYFYYHLAWHASS